MQPLDPEGFLSSPSAATPKPRHPLSGIPSLCWGCKSSLLVDFGMKAIDLGRALSWLGSCTWAQVGLQLGSPCGKDFAIPKAALGSDVTSCHRAIAGGFAWGVPGGLYLFPDSHSPVVPMVSTTPRPRHFPGDGGPFPSLEPISSTAQGHSWLHFHGAGWSRAWAVMTIQT